MDNVFPPLLHLQQLQPHAAALATLKYPEPLVSGAAARYGLSFPV